MKLKTHLLTLVVIAGLCIASGALALKGQTANESPRVMAAVAPATYPAIARAANAHGEVIIEVQVDSAGNVRSAKLVSGYPLLKQISEEAANQWKFSSSEGGTKEWVVPLTFSFQTIDKGPTPKNEFTTVFFPPYKVEVQAHPRTIE